MKHSIFTNDSKASIWARRFGALVVMIICVLGEPLPGNDLNAFPLTTAMPPNRDEHQRRDSKELNREKRTVEMNVAGYFVVVVVPLMGLLVLIAALWKKEH